jgi:hypothetical protein
LALQELGFVTSRGDDSQQAATLLADALALQREIGDKRAIVGCLEGVAHIAEAEGHPEQAARLLRAAAAQRDALGSPLPPVDRGEHDRLVARVEQVLGSSCWAAASGGDEAMFLDEAIEEAIEFAR